MATMQLNVSPLEVMLPSQTVSTTMDSLVKCYDLFTTIGIIVNVTNAAGLTAAVKIQVSVDGTTWGDYAGSSVAVTGNVVIPYNISEFAFAFVKAVITISAGSATFEIKSLAKQG